MARLRLTTDPAFFSDATPPSYLGEASDGEIQDHSIPINTLPVTLAGFSAERVSPDQIAVAWTVATEAGTVGYRVFQDLGAKGVQAVTTSLVPAQAGDSVVALDYEVQIASESDGPLILEELSSAGRTERFGPFDVGSSFGAMPDYRAQPWADATRELSLARQQQQSIIRARSAGGADSAIELRVSQTGIQRIAISALQDAGLQLGAVDPMQLRLQLGDDEVPLWIDGDGTLSPDNHLLFFGQALSGSLYTRARLYRLDLAGGQRRWVTRTSEDYSEHSVDRVRHTIRLDEDRFYSFSSPTDDPWYFDSLRRTSSSVGAKQWPMVLTSVPEGESRLVLELWGGLDYPGEADDHRFAVWFNGVKLGERSFDGLSAQRFNFSLGDRLLKAGANEVRIELLDTGFFADVVRVESIEVSTVVPIDAEMAAEGFTPGNLQYRFDGISLLSFESVDESVQCGMACEQVEIQGLEQTDLIAIHVSGNAVNAFADFPLINDGRGRYSAILPIGRLYGAADNDGASAEQIVVIETESAHTPELSLISVSDHPMSGEAAELVAIAPYRFMAEIEPLLQARRDQGISARVFDVEELYRHYNDGIVDPEAIRSFLKDAHQQWGTRYVLLVGGDSYDYFDRLGLGSVSDVPTFYGEVHNVVRHAPLDHRYSDLDDDGDAELAVGRLPVRTSAELDRLIERILNRTTDLSAGLVFAAERSIPAEGSDYSAEVEEIIAQMLPEWQQGVSRVFLDDYPSTATGTEQARTDLVNDIAAGAALVSYFGHGAPTLWSREQLLQSSQIEALLGAVSNHPIVTEFGCWGGYFVAPQFNSMSHGWLTPASGGAVAMLASSGSDRAQQ